MTMSTIPTPIDRIRAASARRASVRWTLRVLRWVLTLAVTFTGRTWTPPVCTSSQFTTT
ncbi:MAG: hypothetical protein CPSOU_6686 [uncultured Paraburkholderia sp.]|nr:MAG: hypothetical protein CPSOU_6686 [uncultured Paraburkholderia sp.]